MHIGVFFRIHQGYLPVAVLFVLCLLPAASLAAPRTVTIGIVRDGPIPRFPAIVTQIKQEIRNLTADEFEIRFPAAKDLSGNWQIDDIKRAADRLLADPAVDMVLAIGIIASHNVGLRKKVSKPVIATLVIDSAIQGLPFRDGASGVKNLTYINTYKSIEQDVRVFREIVPFRKLTVLVDRISLQTIKGLRRIIRNVGYEYTIDVTLVEVGTSAEEALAKIPSDTRAVYVAPLLRFTEAQFRALTQGLIRRKLPSFSAWGLEEVAWGVLASQSPKSDLTRFTRRIALNVQRILLGEEPGSIPVGLSIGRKLSLNLATARAIGVYPGWNILLEAELLNIEDTAAARRISLPAAVQEAVTVNLDLMATDRGVAAGKQRIKQARSALLPQIDVGAKGVIIDDDRAEAGLGGQAEKTVAGTASLNQLIYAEDAWAGYDIEKKLQIAREQDRAALRLDIALNAAVTYLDVLRAKTLLTIQRSNLRVTRSNLELARNRLFVGYTGPAEVFRWESEIATDRRELLDASARLNQARLALNRLLHRPLEERFRTVETRIDDPSLMDSENLFKTYADNPRHFNLLRDFMVREGLDAAPELKGLRAEIAARERELKAAKRAFWLPAFAVGADVTERFSEQGKGADAPALPFALPDKDDTDWSAGLFATFPLFEGGRKTADVRRTLEELAQLKLARSGFVERIDQQVRARLHDAWASFLGIALAREGALAARKNLELVTEQYSRGKVNVIDLIDAQDASLAADQRAANAVYDFLIDLMKVQRAAGRFNFFMTVRQKKDWRDRLEQYFKGR